MNCLMFPLALAPMAETIVRYWDAPAILFSKLLVIAALVGLNGFFVACEFAIVKVRASQLEALSEEWEVRALFARHGRSHIDAYLSSTLLGITLASMAVV